MPTPRKPEPRLKEDMKHPRHGVVTIIRMWRARRKAIVEDTAGQRHISDFSFLDRLSTQEQRSLDAKRTAALAAVKKPTKG